MIHLTPLAQALALFSLVCVAVGIGKPRVGLIALGILCAMGAWMATWAETAQAMGVGR